MTASEVFTATFLLGLVGAMSPGTLLTFTIMKSIRAQKRGYLEGFFISMGHAVVEIGMIFLLLLGVDLILNRPWVMGSIGLIGAGFLLFMGVTLLIEQKKGFAAPWENDEAKPGEMTRQSLPAFLGGIVFLMSNPWWWLWWLTVGLTLIMQFEVGLANPATLTVFIIAKELGQIFWYTFVALLFGALHQKINRRIYGGILVGCALVLLGYGLYMGYFALQTFFPNIS